MNQYTNIYRDLTRYSLESQLVLLVAAIYSANGIIAHCEIKNLP